ncbi:MAG: permease-like cell division protein FtsX [Firmicutes bacterium]|nr:permease-like cell division protein FtsX [Bacillota bacterium]
MNSGGVTAMILNSLRYCLRQGLVSLRRNFWLAVVTAGMIAISLAILGGFLLVALNAGQMMRTIAENVEIGVFLNQDAEAEAVQSQLESLEGVYGYTFVSKEQGLDEFGQSLGDRELFSGLDGELNPLPDMFRVRAREAALVPSLADEIRALPGVELVDYGEELVARLVGVTRWLNTFFLGISFLLALGAIFLIVTIIRLSVLARQDEIGVMKYLGASNWFIRFPFFLEGMTMGWMGTLAATISLGFAYQRLVSSLQRDALIFFLQPVTDPEKLWPVFAGLLVLGTLMGGLGSLVSVRKFLRV